MKIYLLPYNDSTIVGLLGLAINQQLKRQAVDAIFLHFPPITLKDYSLH